MPVWLVSTGQPAHAICDTRHRAHAEVGSRVAGYAHHGARLLHHDPPHASRRERARRSAASIHEIDRPPFLITTYSALRLDLLPVSLPEDSYTPWRCRQCQLRDSQRCRARSREVLCRGHARGARFGVVIVLQPSQPPAGPRRAARRYWPRPSTDRFSSEHGQTHASQGSEISLWNAVGENQIGVIALPEQPLPMLQSANRGRFRSGRGDSFRW